MAKKLPYTPWNRHLGSWKYQTRAAHQWAKLKQFVAAMPQDCIQFVPEAFGAETTQAEELEVDQFNRYEEEITEEDLVYDGDKFEREWLDYGWLDYREGYDINEDLRHYECWKDVIDFRELEKKRNQIGDAEELTKDVCHPYLWQTSEPELRFRGNSRLSKYMGLRGSKYF